MRFTVATYNIHKGFSQLTRRMVIHELRERLHGLSADILFLQEVQGVARPPREPLSRLAGQAAARVHRRHGVARGRLRQATPSTATATTATRVLSRFPIVGAGEPGHLGARVREPRPAPLRDRSSGERTPVLHCLNVHLGLFERGRQWQIRALVERIKRDRAARRAADHRRRLQRLAAQGRPHAHRRARRGRGVRGGARAVRRARFRRCCRCSASTASTRAGSTSSTPASITRFRGPHVRSRGARRHVRGCRSDASRTR